MMDFRRGDLVRRARRALEQNLAIVVVGWKVSNHDNFTSQLEEGGRVIFFEDIPTTLGSTVGFAMSTRFTGHSEFNRLKSDKTMDVYSSVLSNGEIKRVLVACGDILIAFKPPMDSPVEPTDETFVKQREENTMKNAEKFAGLFLAQARKNNGQVSKYELGDIRRQCEMTGASSALVKAGWIELVVSDGRTKAGYYAASDKLKKLSGVTIEEEGPSNPFVQAKRLIASEPALVEEILQAEIHLQELKDRHDQINLAKELLGKLAELVK